MKEIKKIFWLRKEKKDLCERVKNLDDRIIELSNLGSAPINDMPKGLTIGNPTENYVTKLIGLKEKQKSMILEITSIELKTEELIRKVDDPEIRTLMRAYYIDGLSWNDIAKLYYKYNCDGSTPRKKVKNYLKKH